MRLPAIALLIAISAHAAPPILTPEINPAINGKRAVLAMTFNEGPGAKDWSGNGNNGTVVGATYTSPSSGYSLDGSNDKITCGDINSIDGVAHVTYSAWVKVGALVAYEGVISKGISTTAATSMLLTGFNGNDDVWCEVRNGASTSHGYTTESLIAVGVWHHWCMVFDGSGASNATKLKFYLDGVEKTLTYGGTIATSTASTAAQVVIGNYDWAGAYNINASIDDVNIFDASLSASQVKQLYMQGKEQHP